VNEPIPTNLQILKPSRKRPNAGDIFVVSPSTRGYFFGRLIATDAQIGPMRNCHLLYLFATESKTKHPPSRLLIGDLLMPPLMTNRLPWSRGYFETVSHREFLPGERLPVHCFQELGRKTSQRYWNEYNRELAERFEPCGIYALRSYRTIDDAVSQALGIPPIPD
jgi:Immunity protein 26